MSAFVLETTARLISFVAAAEDAEFDPNTVTPGVIGFAATFIVAAVVVFIAYDMNRRVRRTHYRGEIREKLTAERAQAEQGDQAGHSGLDQPPSETDPRQ